MRKVLLMAGIVCFAAANASAFEFNPYVAAKAKYAFARNEIKATGVSEGKNKYNDDVWGGSLSIGNIYNVMNGDFRLELEYTKNSDAKKNHMKIETQGALFNVYYDFNLRTTIPLKPYVGVGLGWGRAEFKTDRWSIKDNGVSMQIGTGINYKICDHTSIDLGYRYITYGDFDKEYRIPNISYEKIEYKPRAHEIMLGLRYEF
ncbi:MAG: porin family protein [Alphaproteobacteria bacterium]|nr:porin family protein [Alphaproteobacteria bacterium]